MKSSEPNDWIETNQSYLSASLALVKSALQRHAAGASGSGKDPDRQALETGLANAAESMPSPAALQTLCSAFGLSLFERAVLLLCAGMELDASIPKLCASACGDERRAYPTFGLALAAFEEAHWSALAPDAPLRYWRLIEAEPSQGLTTGRLRIDERILHFLAGVQYLDERLAGMVTPVATEDHLAPSLRELAGQVAASWQRAQPNLPLIGLHGRDPVGQQLVAAAACRKLGLEIYRLPLHAMPDSPAEQSAFIRLWEREVLLSRWVLLLDASDTETGNPQTELKAKELLEGLRSPLMIMSRAPYRSERRTAINYMIGNPTFHEQAAIWKTHLAHFGMDAGGHLETITQHFDFNESAIRNAVVAACAQPPTGKDGSKQINGFEKALWQACRTVAKPRLGGLARLIDPVARWEDLVLPEPQKQLLVKIAASVRHRRKVHEMWGFIEKSRRGLGISALFVGASGTGKTMAAEVIANELKLDLYRIDLSAVVSKYIGETEKNLRRIFDAAEAGSAILLFDEADALFGKRSEVKDSHDRYANIEISYLLQKMEEYRGLAILTTNMGDAIDSAFLRRIRFIVRFPLPDAEHRREIWQRVWPNDVPREGLDFQRLAQLNIAGGNIRNIALSAAFLAAEADEPVRMNHLRLAVETEYAKLEKTLTTGEKRGWS